MGCWRDIDNVCQVWTGKLKSGLIKHDSVQIGNENLSYTAIELGKTSGQILTNLEIAVASG